MVPSGAMATPLRMVTSSKFKSNCAAVAAPPSPIEPIAPMPAIAVRRLAALAAAATVTVETPGTENEKSLLGLSTEVSNSWSAAPAATDVAASFESASLG